MRTPFSSHTFLVYIEHNIAWCLYSPVLTDIDAIDVDIDIDIATLIKSFSVADINKLKEFGLHTVESVIQCPRRVCISILLV